MHNFFRLCILNYIRDVFKQEGVKDKYVFAISNPYERLEILFFKLLWYSFSVTIKKLKDLSAKMDTGVGHINTGTSAKMKDPCKGYQRIAKSGIFIALYQCYMDSLKWIKYPGR